MVHKMQQQPSRSYRLGKPPPIVETVVVTTNDILKILAQQRTPTVLRSLLWEFLNLPINIDRMETATYLHRPAVEPLTPHFLQQFNKEDLTLGRKQDIGRMIRRIMETRGYVIDQREVGITIPGNIFKSATRYTKKILP
jgi:hypothetical protein